MKLTIDISQKTLDDLTVLADFYAVLIEDVVRHYITDGIEAEKVQRLGPWESVDDREARLNESFDNLRLSQQRVQDAFERIRMNGNARRVK